MQELEAPINQETQAANHDDSSLFTGDQERSQDQSQTGGLPCSVLAS